MNCSCGHSYITGNPHSIVGNAIIYSGKISNLIDKIREDFIWGQRYTKTGKLLPKTKYIKLKKVKTDHIYGILTYIWNNRRDMLQKLDSSQITIFYIFVYELIYRSELKKV